MKSFSLQVLNLVSEHDHECYKDHSSQINGQNPFHGLELFITPSTDLESLKYFLFSIDSTPTILMIFILRPIFIAEIHTGYYDVISPYSYSGPIFNHEKTESGTMIQFWKFVDRWYKENNVISEFIRFSLNNNHLHYNGMAVPTLNNVKGRIINESEQWQGFKKKVRNNIRKAIGNNLEFEILPGEKIHQNAIEDFHRIYINSLVRNNALERYFYSLEYFEKYVGNNLNCCALATVKKDGKAISVELLLLSDESIYSFLGGTEADYFEYRPNDFLKYNVLNWGRKLDFKYYVLGGGQHNDDSLYLYKKSFFPVDDDVTFFTGRKILDNSKYLDLVRQFNKNSNAGTIANLNLLEGFFPKYRTC